MASAKTATPTTDVADEWETASEESPTRITFDQIGDVFTGIKTGSQELPGDDAPYTQYLFRAVGMTKLGIEDGELCGINESYKLKPLGEIEDGKMCRIEYVKDVEVGRPQPMKDFRIQTKR